MPLQNEGLQVEKNSADSPLIYLNNYVEFERYHHTKTNAHSETFLYLSFYPLLSTKFDNIISVQIVSKLVIGTS